MLTVDVTLYTSELGGRRSPITEIGYGCSCKSRPDDCAAYDCRINFYNKYPVLPGETRRADIFFLTGEDAESQFLQTGRFYLCEAGVIGEARTLPAKVQQRSMTVSREVASARPGA